MRTVLRLVLLGVIVYLLYASGILARVLEIVSGPAAAEATPRVNVTIFPVVIEGSRVPGRTDPTLISTAPPTAAIPLTTETPLPPVTIVFPEPPPTLGSRPTPTAQSSFTIAVEAPRDGETLRVSPTIVIGQTQPNALVSVNDTVGFADAAGRFSLSVPLAEGPNILEVLASNTAGEQVFVIVTVLYQP